MSGIPAEEIEIAKAVGSFPCDASLLTVNAELEWISGPTTLNDWPFNFFEDGHVILYRWAIGIDLLRETTVLKVYGIILLSREYWYYFKEAHCKYGWPSR
jgi:Ubiquitin carboxyl-terminal hydrolase 47 C-terminal